jgi:hypothetical protein
MAFNLDACKRRLETAAGLSRRGLKRGSRKKGIYELARRFPFLSEGTQQSGVWGYFG